MEVTYLANLGGLSWLPQLLPEWNLKQMSEKITVGMLSSSPRFFQCIMAHERRVL